MVNTDTDSESECFESAEESLGEEEEKTEGKTTSKKKSRESESEVSEPVVLQNEKETVFSEDTSVNLSYRKRPERVKRTPSIPSQKVNSGRKKSNETVFKADVADVFFQDITSNLSKNINKSLHTLQQTSSNVKDLILSSLPVPSTTEGENFVYDDSFNISPPSVDNKTSANEALDDKNVFMSDCLSESSKVLPIQDDTFVLDTPIKKETLKINPEDNVLQENTDRILESEANELNNSEIDEKISGFSVVEPDTISTSKLHNKLATVKDNEKGSLKNPSDEAFKALNNENNFESQENKTSVDQFTINNSSQNNLNIIKPESEKQINEDVESKIFSEIVPESKVTKIDNTDVTIRLVQNHSDGLIGQGFHTDSTNKGPETSRSCKNKSIQNEENLKEDKESKGSDEYNETRNSKVDCNMTQDPEGSYELKNNAAGMKTPDVIKVKQDEVKDKDEIQKSHFNVVESTSKSNDVSSGWDDFDFSDDEIEGIQGVDECAKLDKLENKGDMKEKKDILRQASDFVKNEIDTNCNAQTMPPVVSLKKNLEKENDTDKKCEENSEKEGIEEGWDWESWDDETDDVKEKEEESKHKTSIKNYDKPENIPDDGSKWEGWDSFSQRIEEKQGNWNLGTWGVNLLLNKATAVTQGISNVLEAGLGAPDPETLARMQKEEERQLKQEIEKVKTNEQPEEVPKKNSLPSVNLFPVSGITNLVAGVTSKIVEHTKIQEIGSKVLTGGLDTLETFGKKTMEVLQDGDPGLRNKRALLTGNNKPVLSQILREAREKADKEVKQAEEKAIAKKCHFETLFDDFQGMVHLEALEMISRQYELKLEQLKSGKSLEELEDLEGVLEEVEQLCALDDLDINSVLDFKPALQMAVEPLKEEISVEKIIQIHDSANKWLQTVSESDTSLNLLHQKAVSTVAGLTAATVHEFLKAGELLSIKECRKTVDEIDALAKFTNILCMEISKLCEKFILIADTISKKELNSANTISEKVIVMRNNSTSYIKQAFDLLIPVLQAGAAL